MVHQVVYTRWCTPDGNHGIPALNEGFMEFNFINPGHITTTFDRVAIMGEEFKINMFGEVSHLSIGRSQALSPISRWSVHHTKIVMTKRPCAEMTGYLAGDYTTWTLQTSWHLSEYINILCSADNQCSLPLISAHVLCTCTFWICHLSMCT